jgi:hypothetical protein
MVHLIVALHIVAARAMWTAPVSRAFSLAELRLKDD